ncbi:MAG: hypothetical protein KIT72_15015 [Polyangiaceae bacterium]|nr:hypothetical protein [Polyangiaceae bacterium]MCW5791727.1 hypothetical protein [Polyangiaceae bacterium]
MIGPSSIRPGSIGLGSIGLGLVMLASACSKETPDPTCDTEREQARAAALRGEAEPARRSLEAARAACPEKLAFDLDRIEAQIVRHERRAEELAAREKSREVARAPLSAFVSWVGRSRASDKRLPGAECAARGEPGFGYCRAEMELSGGLTATVHYLSRDAAEVFGYQAQVALPVTCADLGPNRVVRRWSQGGDELSHCELTGPALKGLTALLRVTQTDAGEATSVVRVFSRAYADRDPELTAALGARP